MGMQFLIGPKSLFENWQLTHESERLQISQQMKLALHAITEANSNI